MDETTAFLELYGGLPRQGPGSPDSTLAALDLLRPLLPPHPEVLELGCGSGGATEVLARALSGRITAVDLLEVLLERCARTCAGVGAEVRTLQGDMGEPPVAGPYDLVWSEGAAYSIGVERALECWRPLLRPGGGLALTELCWHGADRPAEVAAFFAAEGARVWEESALRQAAQARGYRVLAMPRLPRRSWWDSYYGPLQQAVDARSASWTEPAQQAVLAAARAELDLHATHGAAYGYTWLVARREP